MEEAKLQSSYICTSCKLSKSSDAFSKKQFKRLEKDKDFEIKCSDCLSTQQELHKQQVKQEKKEKQKQKLVDPSQLYHLHPLNAPVMKDFQKFFFNQYGIEPEISLGKKTKWRTSVKLAVRGEIGADKKLDTQIGLFGPGSHSVIDCTNSPAHHTRINEAVKLIKQTINTLEIGGYIEGLNAEDKKINKYKAYLRYLLLSVERKSGLVQLSIIWNATKTTTNATTLLNSLIDQLTESTLVKNNDQFSYKKSRLFHSIWVNYFPVTDIHNNSITGRDREQWELKFGKEYVEESITSDFHYAVAKNKKVVKPLLYFPPFVFRQANIDKFEEIIQFIRRSIQTFQTELKATQSSLESAIFNCLELYGGVGTIGLNCLDLFDRLQCSDENPNNLICFNKSLESFPDALKRKATYRPYGAASSVMNGEVFRNNVIIIDPPRKGIDEETVKALLSSPKVPTVDSAASGTTKRIKISFDEEGNTTENGGSNDQMKRKRLIYVSCGFDAFKRDCLALTGKNPLDEVLHLFQNSDDKGTDVGSKRKRNDQSDLKFDNFWKLTAVQGFVLFPGSDHIETVAVFDRE